MSDVSGIVLHSILKEPDISGAVWPKLKPYFFGTEYNELYAAISKHYNKYHNLPSFEELKITTREGSLLNKIRALELLTIPKDIELDLAVEALVDQYTQEETLEQVLKLVEKITIYDSSDIKQKVSEMLSFLEERTDTSEEVFLMNDIYIFDEAELHNKIPLGLNNSLDAMSGGMALSELVMIGGHRGSGKTVAACNVTTNQYGQGNIGLFFSIEMRYREIFNRFISILADVDNTKLRKMQSEYSELLKIAKVRSEMFADAEEVYEDYKKHKDYEKFEVDLIRSKRLKEDNQLIIIDNQRLTLADIDMNLQKFTAQFGDKLKQ